jgi:hypothetical protein
MLPEHFAVYYDDMNINVDFSIYGVKLNMNEYKTLHSSNISKLTKKEEKDALINITYPVIIINAIFDTENTHIIDHVSIGVRNKE